MDDLPSAVVFSKYRAYASLSAAITACSASAISWGLKVTAGLGRSGAEVAVSAALELKGRDPTRAIAKRYGFMRSFAQRFRGSKTNM